MPGVSVILLTVLRVAGFSRIGEAQLTCFGTVATLPKDFMEVKAALVALLGVRPPAVWDGRDVNGEDSIA